MSMEIQTTFAPLNTTIDADSDYRDLTGLRGCRCRGVAGLEGCGCGGSRQSTQPGVHGLGVAEGGNGILWVLGGLAAAWGLWAWYTPHEEYNP